MTTHVKPSIYIIFQKFFVLWRFLMWIWHPVQTILVLNAVVTAVIRDSRKMKLYSHLRAVHQVAGPIPFQLIVQNYRVVSLIELYSLPPAVHQAELSITYQYTVKHYPIVILIELYHPLTCSASSIQFYNIAIVCPALSSGKSNEMVQSFTCSAAGSCVYNIKILSSII